MKRPRSVSAVKPGLALAESRYCITPRGLGWHAFHRFTHNRAAVISLGVLLAITLFVIAVPLLSPFPYDAINWEQHWLHPDFASGHYLGSDLLGRDLFVRTAMGGRISLLVGVGSTLIAIGVGTLYGILAGYWGGWVDTVMMCWLDLLETVPFILLVILLVIHFGHSMPWGFAIISILSCLNIVRIVRMQTLNLQKKEFILAARLCGVGPFNIILRHIVPNVLGLIVVYSSLLIPSVILLEASISFLGLGVQEPMVSWGILVQSGASTLESTPWALIGPASLLVLTLFCFNLIGDGLRDAFDPQHWKN